MNRLIALVVALLMVSFSVFGQEETEKKATQINDVLTYVEHMPEAPYNVNEFLSRNIDYPYDARDQSIGGRVVIRFVIDESGVIGNITVQKSVYPSIDSEAVRVVRIMPKWKPARNADGEPVKVYFTLPIKFSLGENSPDDPPRIPLKRFISGPILDYAEQMPESIVDINTYVSSQVAYSTINELVGLKGKVVLKFIVTTWGELDSIRVVRSLNPIVDTLAIQILDRMPPWKPAVDDGKAVNVYYTTPISFNFTADTSIRNEETTAIDSMKEKKTEIFTYADQMPEASYSITDYLAKALVYPADARKLKKEGRVVVRFVITESGKITDVKVEQPFFPSLDATAVDVISKMPDWNPGKINGKPVATYFTVPIKFALN